MYNRYYPNNDRFFAFPFLVGALTGGAAVGLTRPRPIIAIGPSYPVYPYPPYPYPPYPYPYFR